MCGIAGVTGKTYNENQFNLFSDMQLSLINRGPDSQSMYIDSNIALLHTRLCVIDKENGRQPMIFEQGYKKFIIVYNGELYNTAKIRNELIKTGYVFNGYSDTEVLLKAYVEWGQSCLGRLNGIFAFAVWECHNKCLFFARDRMGVKPFFYTVKNNTFIFGSEIKAILKHPLMSAKIDKNSIAELLLIGPGRTPGYGVFVGINELPRACYGYFNADNQLLINNYWSIKDSLYKDSLGETIDKVRFLVTDAIKKQLISDVPICTFLSGGLDSSIISSITATHCKENNIPFKTLSVNYKDNDKNFVCNKYQPNSDAEYIKVMNKYLDIEHIEIMLDTPMLVEALYDAVEARDLPGMADIDSSLLLFCREVKKYCTVALSGECADEIFGGYPWYTDETVRNRKGFPWSQSNEYRASFIKDEFLKEINFVEYVNKKYNESINKAHINQDNTEYTKQMKQMMTLNIDWFMQTLLDRKDRMSMRSGLEVRVPFCDHRITEYLYTVPWQIKYLNNNEKGLLREAMKDILPNEILQRKKSPYPKTHNPDFLIAVTKELMNILSDNYNPILQILKKDKIKNLIEKEGSGVPWYGQLMQKPQIIAYFIQLNYWLKKYKVEII
ncbi:MAG: asparagine synthase (glutamine-hydrolyzing) [Clostridiales bacterium GWF2_38_85]|nr:MAG: asparagine synthase (glutamine-hydrolyzing) [Clostridiales bacterium GWF2_38_85]HBL84161.1 asparagine synthase (glutamine-hydrolyzing) [Clostridiales bacterium]